MESGYKTKDMRAPKSKIEKVLPIFQKRQHWCFKLNGQLFKYSSEAEAKSKYKELNK